MYVIVVNVIPGLVMVSASIVFVLMRKRVAELVERQYEADRHILWRLRPGHLEGHELNTVLVAAVLFITGVVGLIVGVVA